LCAKRLQRVNGHLRVGKARYRIVLEDAID
jgi:hypothetical protein